MCLAELARADPRAADAEVLACSSAGGGLRIAVVGNEELVTAEAGRRVALSSGGKVVTVRAVAQGHDLDLTADTPDVVLLTGGTDGGNHEPILRAAQGLKDSGWRGPTVVAGNVDARDEVSAILAEVPHVLADNVVPRIGVLAPESARAAIREVFLSHVIGGKHLSKRGRGDFTAMVRGATPDVVLTGVELLARAAGEVVVVDVGGATTDVHSVVEVDPEQAELARDVVAPTPVTRTVEGDLGMRWSAISTVDEAGLPDLDEAARTRRDEPRLPPHHRPGARRGRGHRTVPPWPSPCAGTRAARRWWSSPEGRVIERTGVDLREVDLRGRLRRRAAARPRGRGRPGPRSQHRSRDGGLAAPRARPGRGRHRLRARRRRAAGRRAPRRGVPPRDQLLHWSWID